MQRPGMSEERAKEQCGGRGMSQGWASSRGGLRGNRVGFGNGLRSHLNEGTKCHPYHRDLSIKVTLFNLCFKLIAQAALLMLDY